MSTHLRLPLDFERLPEFRLLCAELRKISIPPHPLGDHIESIATRLWLRLYVELGYQARTTNQPGLLNAAGGSLFHASVSPLFGEDVAPLQLLVAAGALKLDGAENGETEGPYFCARFAQDNAHLAGDFKSKEKVGAENSAIVRQQRQLTQDSLRQAMLLSPEVFKKRDGTLMSDTEKNRAILLIKNVDNALDLPERRAGQYTEGLLSDAGAVIESHEGERLKEFYFWLRNHREKPGLPKTTEQVLADFENIYGVAV